jgi:rhodanese-related sulfurtransferase
MSPAILQRLDPARRVIVYCRSGHRAALAAATLRDMGFDNVANLTRDINAWQEAGLSTSERHEGL